MKAIIYKTKTLPDKQGKRATIRECWIEDVGLCINEKNEIFSNNRPRTVFEHLGSIDIPPNFGRSLKNYFELGQNIEKNTTLIFNAIEKKSNTTNPAEEYWENKRSII